MVAPVRPMARVSFENDRGSRLVGEIFLAGEQAPLVVFSHGLGSGKASPRNRALAAELGDRGIGSFLFDYTGHGESEGTLADSSLEQQTFDLGAALDYLDQAYGGRLGEIGVNGSSTGGTAALFRAAQDPRIRALVVRSVRDYGVLEAASRVTVPTLVIQGGEDRTVLPESERIYRALAGPKEYVVIPGAGHLFAEDPQYTARMTQLTVDWFVRYLLPVRVG